jgi:hypothetical protein
MLNRIHSIDTFRAAIIFLMLFLNGLESITGIPGWLKSTPENVDALGLSDTVLPLLLFTLGLSIPFKMSKWNTKTSSAMIDRIVWPSLLLIVFGFYEANAKDYNTVTAMLSKPVWNLMLTLSFILVTLDYRNRSVRLQMWPRGLGFILLGLLSVIYRSHLPDQPWLHMAGWGILGLIGWSYLICALLYVYTGGILWIQAGSWLFFLLFNLDYHYGWLDFLKSLQPYFWLAGDGAMQAFTMAGIFVSVLHMRLTASKEMSLLWVALGLMALIFLNLAFIVREFSGGISTARYTPAWALICTAINLTGYVLFTILADFKRKKLF